MTAVGQPRGGEELPVLHAGANGHRSGTDPRVCACASLRLRPRMTKGRRGRRRRAGGS